MEETSKCQVLSSVTYIVDINQLFQEKDFNLTREQAQWVVGIMLSVTLVKLVLCIYCRSFTNEIVKAYAQDHFFDVVTNMIGLIAVLLANYISDWMDPVGAIIVSSFGSSLYVSPCIFYYVVFLKNFFFLYVCAKKLHRMHHLLGG